MVPVGVVRLVELVRSSNGEQQGWVDSLATFKPKVAYEHWGWNGMLRDWGKDIHQCQPRESVPVWPAKKLTLDLTTQVPVVPSQGVHSASWMMAAVAVPAKAIKAAIAVFNIMVWKHPKKILETKQVILDLLNCNYKGRTLFSLRHEFLTSWHGFTHHERALHAYIYANTRSFLVQSRRLQ